MTTLPPSSALPPLDHHQSLSVGKEPELNKVFIAAAKLGASDVHLKAGSPPRMRVKGELRSTNTPPLTEDAVERLIFELLTPDQKQYLLSHGTVDFAHDAASDVRFRVNVFRQRGRFSLVGRFVPRDIPNFAQLHLPAIVEQLAGTMEQGLILLAGITGSGKSTTIAAMLEHINCTRSQHVVTVEDPIEFLYTDKKAIFNQREVGLDTPSFSEALRTLMREDPDVVLIGEMRDRETFDAALHAAETGHLVLGTVHAGGSAQTILRVLDLYPPEDRELVRQNFAFNLRAILCQKLLPSIKPGLSRVPAVEVLLNNPVTKKFILDKRENELNEVIRKHGQEGMIEFNDALKQLVGEGLVDHKTAYEYSPNPDELRMRLKGFSNF